MTIHVIGGGGGRGIRPQEKGGRKQDYKGGGKKMKIVSDLQGHYTILHELL